MPALTLICKEDVLRTESLVLFRLIALNPVIDEDSTNLGGLANA